MARTVRMTEALMAGGRPYRRGPGNPEGVPR
jgi:hypothetical protein